MFWDEEQQEQETESAVPVAPATTVSQKNSWDLNYLNLQIWRDGGVYVLEQQF